MLALHGVEAEMFICLVCIPPAPGPSYGLIQATTGTGTVLIWDLI